MLQTMIEKHGITTDTAISGKKAASLVMSRLNSLYFEKEAKMYKLILVDFSMPEMDGPELVKIIIDLMG